MWANPSATLTGDQNLRVLFRVASPIQGTLGHSEGCRKPFREMDLVRGRVTHLPIEMSIRITASLAPPGFPVTLRIREWNISLLTMERATERQRYVSAASHESRRTLTITTRIQPYIAH